MRNFVGQVVNPCILYDKIVAVMTLLPTLPQQTDHLNGLRELFLAHFDLGPAFADDVLVQICPLPTPRKKRPGIKLAAVAAA